jgi:hypothetical protein
MWVPECVWSSEYAWGVDCKYMAFASACGCSAVHVPTCRATPVLPVAECRSRPPQQDYGRFAACVMRLDFRITVEEE